MAFAWRSAMTASACRRSTGPVSALDRCANELWSSAGLAPSNESTGLVPACRPGYLWRRRGQMDSVRILLADDHPVFRHGLRTLLTETPDLEVVGEATTGEDAVALSETLQPDLVLMDLRMPGTSGVDATRRIVHASPHVRVLVVTMFDEDASVFTAMRAVARGEAIFSPGVASRIVDFFAATRPAAPKQAFPTLSERERELLHLLAQGHSNASIAGHLFLSQKTVANYVSTILNKLQVADR